MAKQAITQRSFILGQPREEFLEASDLDLADNSLRLAENVRIKATRTIAQRHGSDFLRSAANNPKGFEIRPADGLVYCLEIEATGVVRVVNASAATVWSGTMAALSPDEVASLWVEGFADLTVIGTADRMMRLIYSNGSFALSAFVFDVAPGDELAQPYWAYTTGIQLTPSALSGAITVAASSAVFSAAWVGMRIRYHSREITITGYTSPTQVSGTVQSQLPPTFRLSLSTTLGFKVGDTLVGQITDYRGYIIAVGAGTVDVVTLDFFDGPDLNEKISAPSGTAILSAKAIIAPGPSPIWDEPLISPVRGYPRSGAGVSGKLVLCDFPAAPDAVAISSARSITDFRVGDEDDDAICRAFGDNRPRFLHVVNAGDILLFADRGCYLINLRDGTLLTPATVNVIAFDARGATTARPAKVDGGVVFIEASGSALAAATLSGDFYSKWNVRTLSTFHDQLFPSPILVCGPPPNSVLEDKYLFVVNADGGMTVMSWVDGFDVESVGFVPWTTDGKYLDAIPVFGGYWFLTERTVDDTGTPAVATFWERLSSTAIMDCEMSAATINAAFDGTTMHVAGQGWYSGTDAVSGTSIPSLADLPAGARVGFNFVSRVMPWAKRMLQHPKAGLLACRIVRFSASVLSTGPVDIRANAITQSFGGYSFGDDLSEPAPEMTKIIRVSVVGRRDHPELEIIKTYPARMQILSVTQEVAL